MRGNIAALHSTYIRNDGVDGIGAKDVVIAAESCEAALRAATYRLVLSRVHKEHIVNRRCPVVRLLRVCHLVLDVAVLQCGGWISRGIHPRASQNGILWRSAARICVLRIVGIQAAAPDILTIAQDQAVVVGAHRCAGPPPEDYIHLRRSSHHRAAAIRQVVAGSSEMIALRTKEMNSAGLRVVMTSSVAHSACTDGMEHHYNKRASDQGNYQERGEFLLQMKDLFLA